MKWILFTGTWRLTDKHVENDVRKAVRDVIERGVGVLTGGATGVDFFAMDEASRMDRMFSHLKIIIPAQLEDYIRDVYTNWCTPPITREEIDMLATLLRKMKNIRPDHLIEMPYTLITQEHYDLRNLEEVKAADEVYAFQVNNSSGTQHTIDKSKKAGLSVTVHKKYTIK